MRFIVTLIIAVVGIFVAGIIMEACEKERKTTDYDIDSDGGFFDDWRMP